MTVRNFLSACITIAIILTAAAASSAEVSVFDGESEIVVRNPGSSHKYEDFSHDYDDLTHEYDDLTHDYDDLTHDYDDLTMAAVEDSYPWEKGEHDVETLSVSMGPESIIVAFTTPDERLTAAVYRDQNKGYPMLYTWDSAGVFDLDSQIALDGKFDGSQALFDAVEYVSADGSGFYFDADGFEWIEADGNTVNPRLSFLGRDMTMDVDLSKALAR